MNKVSYIIIFLLSLWIMGPASAQWMAYTSSRDVRALSPAPGAIWAASSGGVFRYDTFSGEINAYTAVDGLHEIQANALAYDVRRDIVWIGYGDGTIDRLDVGTGTVRAFYDIRRSDRFPSKEINQLYVRGDSLFVATNFGVVVFDPVRAEIRDTYSKLGWLSSPVAVRDMIFAEVPQGGLGLWLATDQGIAHVPMDAPNLQDPAAWTIETDINPSSNLNAIAGFGGTIFVGSARGLSRRTDSGYYENTRRTTRDVLDLAALPDRLLILSLFTVAAETDRGAYVTQARGYLNLRTLIVDDQQNFWVGDADKGLSHYERPSGTGEAALITGEIYPSGPFDSPFGDLAVDTEGSLWAAQVEGLTRAGFYLLEQDGTWTNFTQRFFDELAGRSNYWRVHTDAQNNAWAGSRGGGLARVDASRTVTIFDHTNSSLQPAAGTESYVIVSGMANDEDDALWLTNLIAPSPLHVRTSDDQWTAFAPLACSGGLGITTALGRILVDSSGIKWIVAQSRLDLRLTVGIIALDTGGTPTDPSDDRCQFFGGRGSAGRGLPSPQINTIIEDDRGRVWIGTDEGPAYFTSSTFAATDPAAQSTWPVLRQPGEEASYLLRGLIINDIAVDPSGQIWFATDNGVFLVSDYNGFAMEDRFTSENSPLLSDNVEAIAIDGGTGLVFMATDKGLVSYQGRAVQSATTVQDLFIYPNPVRIMGEQSPEISIEGLVAETQVKILSVNGELVAEFPTRGGRAAWDGRDRNGQLVPSGVYLVAAVGSSGEGTAYGKVAVIR